QGPPGSGKTFAARILRSLIDPSTSPLTPNPANLGDLLTLARHNWILAFDHVSTLSPPLTGAICRLSSGLGATLHETPRRDPEPLQQTYRCPVLLTVTGSWSCPGDIAERALVIDLPPIPPENRRTEASLTHAFHDAWPAILGALCSAVATALHRTVSESPAQSGPSLPQPLDPVPNPCALPVPNSRLPDALAWAAAASPVLGSTDEEMRQAFDPPPTPHPLVEAVRNLLEQRRQWTGNATELLHLLGPSLSCPTPTVVGHQLRASALTLADSGIEVRFRRLHQGARTIELRRDSGDADASKSPESASPDSAPSFQATETKEVNS
ncbi:MAG TPA: hypothetical protein VGH38_06920, partial [Bryobacteraceae bacterium]